MKEIESICSKKDTFRVALVIEQNNLWMCFEIAIYIDSIHYGCILPAVYAAVEPYCTTVNALIDEFRKMKGPKISFCGISGIFVEHFFERVTWICSKNYSKQ